eukprot:3768363-Pleurochrysis_carterae.AAC.3
MGSVAGSRSGVLEGSCDAAGAFATSGSEGGATGSSSRAPTASSRGSGLRGADGPPHCVGGKHELTARERVRLRLAGYSALSREDQLPHRFWPPTCVEWVE